MFPYSQARVDENKAGKEKITSKQVWFISKLSKERKDKDQLLNEIMDSIPGDLDIEDLSKGQAMFVIKCLLGDILPSKPRLNFQITNDDIRRTKEKFK